MALRRRLTSVIHQNSVQTMLKGKTLTAHAPYPVAVLRWGQGAQAPQILPTPQFLDTVVLLLVELIGSIVNFA